MNKELIKKIDEIVEQCSSGLVKNNFSAFLIDAENAFGLDTEDLQILFNFFANNLKIGKAKLISTMNAFPDGFFENDHTLKEFIAPKCIKSGIKLLKGSSVNKIECASLTIIPQDFAADCKNLMSVDLAKAEQISQGAFKNCSNLREVALSDSCQYIAKTAFEGCDENKLQLFLPSAALDTITFEGWDIEDENDTSDLAQFYTNIIRVTD